VPTGVLTRRRSRSSQGEQSIAPRLQQRRRRTQRFARAAGCTLAALSVARARARVALLATRRRPHWCMRA